MTRLPIIAAAVLAIAASAPVIFATTTPASAQGSFQGWQDRGEMDGDLRDLLRDRIRTREDLQDLIAALHERQDLRGRMRERISNWRDREDDEGDGDWRGRLQRRLAGRMAERPHGGEGECYFLTRSLRDEDGDLLVIVRRRVCGD